VVITGPDEQRTRALAKALEEKLFEQGMKAYYLGVSNIALGLEADIIDKESSADEHMRRLGELARIMTDSGQLFITTMPNADDYDLQKIKLLNQPNEILVVNVGDNNFETYPVDLQLSDTSDASIAVSKICALLKHKEIIVDYSI
jgi:bifunctional enzyme CysN/CysC